MKTVTEDKFEQDFVWYEWSFVHPTDVPRDDAPARRRDDRARSPRMKVADRWEDEGRWTT